MKRKVGLVVNPVAGMGGSVGLKGTDGAQILRMARELGARPVAPRRAAVALRQLAGLRESIDLFAYPQEMGAVEAVEAGFEPIVVGSIQGEETTALDTEQAARTMAHLGVDLLLFAGGDGTAVDVYRSVGDRLPAVGIPAGVKMHSAVFGVHPRAAGDLAAAFLSGRTTRLREAEVMDIDEQAFRAGRVSARLHGYLKVPAERTLAQSLKAESPGGHGEDAAVDAIAFDVVDRMQDDHLYVIGPGTTTRAIKVKLGLDYTLLGVDVVWQRKLMRRDANEAHLRELTEGRRAKIVVTPIGGQGFLFGRGNQQLSPAVIRAVGRENIVVVATVSKINALNGRPLLVDTGDDTVNTMLSGYVRVTTGYNEQIVYEIAC